MTVEHEIFSHLSDDIGKIEDLERFRFTGDDGGWYAVIGLSTRFFVTDGHFARRRGDAIDAMRSYYSHFKHKLTHYVTDTGAARRLNGIEAFEFFTEKKSLDSQEMDALTFGLAGFPHSDPREQPLYNECRAMMNMESENNIYLYSDWTASLSFSALRHPYQKDLIDRVYEWATILKPRHGTSGISFLIDQDFDHSRISKLLFPHLMRYPGLDYDDGGNWAGIAGLNDKLRSINWLTIIDDKFVEQLGGLTALEVTLGPECPIRRYDGGIVIQAGPRPEVGDVNFGVSPRHYQTVSQALKPLRFEQYHIPLITPPPPLDPIEETLRWIRRFD